MRFNKVGAILGQRGTGKSLFLIGSKYACKPDDIKLNLPGVLEIYAKKNMKVLIIDTLDHPAYKKIPIISQKDFKKWNKGIVRTYLEPDDIKRLVDFMNKAPNLNNTLIVFEDATKYTETKLAKSFKRIIADSKQRNIDIIFMYHSWGQTPLDLFRNMDFIQLFKTKDSPKVRESSLVDYEEVLREYERIKADKNNFITKYIDTSTL